VWERWKAGHSISVIAKAVGSPAGSIFSILLPFGGCYQAPQRRRASALSRHEREEISRGVAALESYRSIGRRLGRPASTVSREIARNRGARKYRAVDADDRAWRRAKRPKRCHLAQQPALTAYVADRLREDWSPEHIACTLRKQYPHGSAMRVSHETIYGPCSSRPAGYSPASCART
jgi:IS30 family transposase